MEKEQHCLLLNTRLQNIFTTNTFKPFNIKEIMKKILFLLLFVLTANNNVFSQNKDDESSEIIINLERIFPYGLPKNIKGYATDHKGKDSLFLDMKFKLWSTEDEEINYNLVQQIINGRDTVHFAYGIETPIMNYGLFKDGYIGFKGNDIGQIAIINYSIKRFMEEFEEDGGKYGTDTRLVLNKEGFAKWALDIETARGYGGYVFNYNEEHHIISISSPHGDNYFNQDQLLSRTYPNIEVHEPSIGNLLFRDDDVIPSHAFGHYLTRSYYCNLENPIFNNSGIMVDMLLDFNPATLLYYAGLLGLPCSFLPNTCYESGTRYEYDGDGLNFVKKSTFTWAFSNYTKKTKSGETESIELPTEVVIDYTYDLEKLDGTKLTRTDKKEILNEILNEPQKVVFTFEW